MIWPVSRSSSRSSDAPTETLGSGSDAEKKTVLYFRNGVKPMPLNMTNWDAVAAIAGDDTEDWPGHRLELYPTTTELKGKVVDCIRIRAPRQKEQKPKAEPGVPPTDERHGRRHPRSERSLAVIHSALALAARGFHIFPCRPRDKRPATANGLKDATTDPDMIQAWWHATTR